MMLVQAMSTKPRRASPVKSLQATFAHEPRLRSLRKGNKQPHCCPKGEGRLTSFTAALASQSSTDHGQFRANRKPAGEGIVYEGMIAAIFWAT
jgi:hypothetical protein